MVSVLEKCSSKHWQLPTHSLLLLPEIESLTSTDLWWLALNWWSSFRCDRHMALARTLLPLGAAWRVPNVPTILIWWINHPTFRPSLFGSTFRPAGGSTILIWYRPYTSLWAWLAALRFSCCNIYGTSDVMIASRGRSIWLLVCSTHHDHFSSKNMLGKWLVYCYKRLLMVYC